MEAALSVAQVVDIGEQTGGAIYLDYEVAGYSTLMGEYDRALAQPYWHAREEFERLGELASGGRWGVFQGMLSGVYGRVPLLAAFAQAEYELDNMALAAEAYRIDHGAYPKTASDLTPNYLTLVPLDPFSGEPMKVKAQNGGVVLYSIGPDMADDGGKPFDQTSRKGDITFRLPAP